MKIYNDKIILKNMINPKFLKITEELNKTYSNNTPFKNIVIENLFEIRKVQQLNSELRDDYYYQEDHDLYQFLRTVDFEDIQENEIIQEFRRFILSEEFVQFIEKVTNEKIERGIVELHSLKLLDTNYLLCHDDEVENRKIAFILYLTTTSKEEGGKLEFFDVDSSNLPNKVSKTIVPKINQFVMFKVSDKSYHQISEFIGDGERKSISGWFY